MNQYWVYIIECANGSYYTGYTTDLMARYHSHVDNTGGCKYTRSFKPVKLAQAWYLEGPRGLAMRIEAFIKAKTVVVKRQLVAQPQLLAVWAQQDLGLSLTVIRHGVDDKFA